jgi:hypothetical protein
MSIGDCEVCRKLLGDAEVCIRHHVEALHRSQIAARMERWLEVSSLDAFVRECSLRRENAVAKYESHMSEHQTSAMTAGSSA